MKLKIIAIKRFIIIDPNGETVHTEGNVVSNANTNNEAEYIILCYSLQICKASDVKILIINSDSLFVIEQIQGVWKCQK